MLPITKPADHPPVAAPKIGVLLVNLGTPDAPTPKAVRRYLAEFLSDRRVVELPPLLWQMILRGIILNVRPRKSAHAYRAVWTERGSPLAFNTADLAAALTGQWGECVRVEWAMRYGSPSIGERLRAMQANGCARILIAPLYPQYCGATTATVVDEAARVLGRMRWQPSLRTLPPYHDDPGYIDAIVQGIRAHLATLDHQPDHIIASFHGMPTRTLMKGDPYHCQCVKTARLVGDALGRPLVVTFQSRFGSAKWLEPATDTTITALAEKGAKSIAVVTPGFAADCLETLEEIGIRARDDFIAAGGENFTLIPCLNAHNDAIPFYRTLIGRELAGWIDTTGHGKTSMGEDG